MKGIRLDSSEKNQWILTKNMDIFKITSITENNKEFLLHGNVLAKRNQENLYDLLFASKNMCIFKSTLESTPLSINFEDIYRISL